MKNFITRTTGCSCAHLFGILAIWLAASCSEETTTNSETKNTDATLDLSPPETAEECLTTLCMDEIANCMSDVECAAWMGCIQACGDDTVGCPTFCGMFYQTPLSNKFIECATNEECLEMEEPSVPDCAPPNVEVVDTSGLEGVWWYAASTEEEHIFDYDCSKFLFEKTSENSLNVFFTVPLTHNGEERVSQTTGTFIQDNSGTVKVVYQEFAAYFETWHLLHKSENALLAYVCFVNGNARSKYYGQLVLTRMPYDELDQAEYDALQNAATEFMGEDLSARRAAKMTEDCTNE
jgi:hypothetical protein